MGVLVGFGVGVSVGVGVDEGVAVGRGVDVSNSDAATWVMDVAVGLTEGNGSTRVRADVGERVCAGEGGSEHAASTSSP